MVKGVKIMEEKNKEEDKVGWIIVICSLLTITSIMSMWNMVYISIKIAIIITSVFIGFVISKIIKLMYIEEKIKSLGV